MSKSTVIIAGSSLNNNGAIFIIHRQELIDQINLMHDFDNVYLIEDEIRYLKEAAQAVSKMIAIEPVAPYKFRRVPKQAKHKPRDLYKK